MSSPSLSSPCRSWGISQAVHSLLRDWSRRLAAVTGPLPSAPPDRRRPSVDVVVPAYNEAQVLGLSLPVLHGFLATTDLDWRSKWWTTPAPTGPPRSTTTTPSARTGSPAAPRPRNGRGARLDRRRQHLGDHRRGSQAAPQDLAHPLSDDQSEAKARPAPAATSAPPVLTTTLRMAARVKPASASRTVSKVKVENVV